jgi:hypothetical protein
MDVIQWISIAMAAATLVLQAIETFKKTRER